MPYLPKTKKKSGVFRGNADTFYNHRMWRAKSREVLSREPICRECAKYGDTVPATHVDHIIPRSQGGSEYGDDNLQALCRRCHMRKTARDKR